MRGTGCAALILAIAQAVAAAAGAPPAQGARPVFRPSDTRPRHDAARLMERGVRLYESKRLKLYTDVGAEKVKTIGPAVDAAYDALVEYFGPLPPTREGNEFQVTGYLMADQALFRRLGLLTEHVPGFLHGRHQGLEFWANEQETDYYRRHLVIHEFTHCFMFAGPGAYVPRWYMEGMAELFATHRLDEQGRFHFRVMPDREENFEGLGRMSLVRSEVAQHRPKSLDAIRGMGPREYLDNIGYGWAWAACAFLDGHPRSAQRFRELGKRMTADAFPRSLRNVFGVDWPDLQTEWSLFSHQLQHGHDIARAAVDFKPGRPLDRDQAGIAVWVAADRGWQSSGVLVKEGQKYRLTSGGRATLGRVPKPWVSEPGGISILYSEGRPIGTLLAAVRRAGDDGSDESMLHEVVVGSQTTLVPSATGTLYLRINDRWGSLADNDGGYRVQIRALAPATSAGAPSD